MASSHLQDAARTLAGLAMVAREAALASKSLQRHHHRFLPPPSSSSSSSSSTPPRLLLDFSAFLSSSLSRLLLSAGDACGITRGTPHYPPPLRADIIHGSGGLGSSPADSPPAQTSPSSSTTALKEERLDISPDGAASQSSAASSSFSSVVFPAEKQHGEEELTLAKATDSVSWKHDDDSTRVTSEDDRVSSSSTTNTTTITGVNSSESAAENTTIVPPTPSKRRPRERRVPSTPLGRAFGFARLGADIAFGTFQESAKRLWRGPDNSQNQQFAFSPFINEKNAERLALGLCRMRGAALKLGQMLSIQDESLLPPQVLSALEVVRQGADVMPKRQLQQVITGELGPDWQSRLASFDDAPMAAASIGQVHKAVLKDGMEVAMKIQYPGVAQSIDSDIENVRRLLEFTNLLPKGLYLEQAMKVAKEELARECNYVQEAASQTRFRQLFGHEKGIYVPRVISEFSSERVLTSEFVPGVSIDKVSKMSQSTRNSVGSRLLHLTLQELFVHRFMQTDPNWSNFLYDEASDTINLIDFGAAREYPKHFVDDYLEMVYACANQDRKNVIDLSCKLGFLTGEESPVMLDAHCEAAFVVGLPFSRPGGFDFHASNLTKRVSELGAVMLRHRLTPPPEEAYSLHRKLSGAFLACIKLQAVVPCRELFLEVYEQHKSSVEKGGAN